MKVEYCELLVDAMVNQAVKDYVISTKRLPKLKKRLANCGEFRQKKKNESDNLYRQRKYQKSAIKYSKDIRLAEELIQSSEEFLLSDWLEDLLDINGSLLLEKIDEQLRKEGYEV